MIFVQRNHNKTHTHTYMFVFLLICIIVCIYFLCILCHQLLLLYFCEFSAAFCLSPLLAAPHTFIASTKLRRHWRHATGQLNFHGFPRCLSISICLSLSLASPTRSTFSSASHSLLMIALAFLYTHIYRETLYTTGYIAYFREKHIWQTTALPMRMRTLG